MYGDPKQPMSPNPWSSAKTTTTFGGSAVSVGTTPRSRRPGKKLPPDPATRLPPVVAGFVGSVVVSGGRVADERRWVGPVAFARRRWSRAGVASGLGRIGCASRPGLELAKEQQPVDGDDHGRNGDDGRPEDEQSGFYGLDVYSLYESLEAVIDYLDDVDPEAATDAREAYRCFEPYGEDAQEYARALQFAPASCQNEVVELLEDLRRNAPAYAEVTDDDAFNAEQNALVARNAESYYRAMVGGDEDSWNVRDRHMTQTLNRLLDYHGPDAKGIVWAHNTHVGDARATDMPRHGRINIGQLAREQDTIDDVELVGFGSTHGEVIASDAWGAEMETMDIPRAKSNSYEDVFNRAMPENALLFSEALPDGDPLETARGHRAVGVVYHPHHESGNYVPTVLPDRYDAFVHIDETTALHPVELHPDRERVPELYPYGL